MEKEHEKITMPCEECILYALCKSKGVIKCELLHTYAVEVSMDFIHDDIGYWKHLRTVLPEVYCIERKENIYHKYDDGINI